MHALEPSQTASLRYASGFARMFWAFLFLGLTIRVGTVLGNVRLACDLLPDFVGYLLIAAGANRLLPLHAKARGIRNLALLLTFLAMPDCVQYLQVIYRKGDLFSALMPYSLGIVLAPLDIILVWKLCGLIADVAHSSFVARTEQCALRRRVWYVVLKLLGLVAIWPIIAAPQLIIPVAIGGLILGVVVLCLMMGLMRQAERLCAAGFVLGELESVESRSGLGFRLLMLLALVLPVCLAGGFVWYYQQWTAAREALYQADATSNYEEVIDAFWQDIEQDRLDAAYAQTTPKLRESLSREQFEQLVRQNPAIHTCRAKNNGSGAGSGSGSMGGSYANRRYTVKNDDGTFTTFMVTARRGGDSLFQRQPPPPGVDEVTIQKGEGQGFMQPFGRGRLR